MIDLQKMINAISEAGFNQRSEYHLTLGGLVDKLCDVDEKMLVVFDFNDMSPCEPHSYRGYYSDLAFESADKDLTVKDFIKLLEGCIGKTFEGYKGGDFDMSENTPLWCANHGSCGRAVIDFYIDDGKLKLTTKEVE